MPEVRPHKLKPHELLKAKGPRFNKLVWAKVFQGVRRANNARQREFALLSALPAGEQVRRRARIVELAREIGHQGSTAQARELTTQATRLRGRIAVKYALDELSIRDGKLRNRIHRAVTDFLVEQHEPKTANQAYETSDALQKRLNPIVGEQNAGRLAVTIVAGLLGLEFSNLSALEEVLRQQP